MLSDNEFAGKRALVTGGTKRNDTRSCVGMRSGASCLRSEKVCFQVLSLRQRSSEQHSPSRLTRAEIANDSAGFRPNAVDYEIRAAGRIPSLLTALL
jgi:hypothetical protein